MFIFGKLLAGLFGLMLFGPLGAILGVWLGHRFDKALNQEIRNNRGGQYATEEVSSTFFKSTFLVMGHLAKADGRVTEIEIAAARKTMQQLGLSEEEKHQAIQYFNEGKQPDFDFAYALREFTKRSMFEPRLRKLFLEVQLQAAFADGVLHPREEAILRELCRTLGFPSSVIENLKHRFQAEQGFYSHQQSPPDELKDAYGILDVPADAPDKEVKKAYRKLMNEHHPDKLAAKGLPEHMKKMATEKTQTIQKAYDVIKRSRGL